MKGSGRTGRWLPFSLVLVIIALMLALFGCGSEQGPGAPAAPGEEGEGERYTPLFDAAALDGVLQPVREQLEAGAFPGAAVAIGIRDREAHAIGLGDIGWTRNAAPVDPDSTIYDLASVTKVMATASAVLLLMEDGLLELDDPVSLYLPNFSEGPKADITLRHLLTHSSGLPEGADFLGEDRAERIRRATAFPIYPPAGARQQYSDVGFVLLWEAAEAAAGEPLTEYLQRRLYLPLGMCSTGYAPGLDCERCAPTGRLRDQSLYRGRPFDPIAQRLDDVSGNAGLFATARDVGRFAAMITSGGALEGTRIFREQTVEAFLAPQPVGDRFRLGWEVYCAPTADSEDDELGCRDPFAIGHTGWTGTSLWLDPESGLWVVLLANRTYEPRAPNRIQRVRREMFEAALQVVRTASNAGGDEGAERGSR